MVWLQRQRRNNGESNVEIGFFGCLSFAEIDELVVSTFIVFRLFRQEGPDPLALARLDKIGHLAGGGKKIAHRLLYLGCPLVELELVVHLLLVLGLHFLKLESFLELHEIIPDLFQIDLLLCLPGCILTHFPYLAFLIVVAFEVSVVNSQKSFCAIEI